MQKRAKKSGKRNTLQKFIVIRFDLQSFFLVGECLRLNMRWRSGNSGSEFTKFRRHLRKVNYIVHFAGGQPWQGDLFTLKISNIRLTVIVTRHFCRGRCWRGRVTFICVLESRFSKGKACGFIIAGLLQLFSGDGRNSITLQFKKRDKQFWPYGIGVLTYRERRFTQSWSTQSLVREKPFEFPELWRNDEIDSCGQQSLDGWRLGFILPPNDRALLKNDN